MVQGVHLSDVLGAANTTELKWEQHLARLATGPSVCVRVLACVCMCVCA